MRRAAVFGVGVAALGAAACGSTPLDTDPLAVADASCAVDASLADAADASDDQSPPADVVILDMGFNGRASDAALSQCQTDQDCDGWATCQEGLCCSGTLSGDICLCGDGAGCDLRHACCVPFSSTTSQPECVDDCVTACGCESP